MTKMMTKMLKTIGSTKTIVETSVSWAAWTERTTVLGGSLTESVKCQWDWAIADNNFQLPSLRITDSDILIGVDIDYLQWPWTNISRIYCAISQYRWVCGETVIAYLPSLQARCSYIGLFTQIWMSSCSYSTWLNRVSCIGPYVFYSYLSILNTWLGCRLFRCSVFIAYGVICSWQTAYLMTKKSARAMSYDAVDVQGMQAINALIE